MSKSANIKIPESAIFPPIPKHFKPIFLIGKNSIKASVEVELNAVFKDHRELLPLKEAMRLALWNAIIQGSDKLE
jgi:hypothetical protein